MSNFVAPWPVNRTAIAKESRATSIRVVTVRPLGGLRRVGGLGLELVEAGFAEFVPFLNSLHLGVIHFRSLRP
jgi:hypothetical protein